MFLSFTVQDRAEKAAEQGSLWYGLFRALHHLIAAEKGYFSLSFLERSWMFKREVGGGSTCCHVLHTSNNLDCTE